MVQREQLTVIARVGRLIVIQVIMEAQAQQIAMAQMGHRLIATVAILDHPALPIATDQMAPQVVIAIISAVQATRTVTDLMALLAALRILSEEKRILIAIK